MTNEPDVELCACGDPVWHGADKCPACLYDDEIEHQTDRIIERMHGIDN